MESNIKQEFIWKPVSEFPKELQKPVICLTQYGHIVTFNCMGNPKKLINGEPQKYYSRFRGCIYWAYTEDLAPNIEYKKKLKY